MATTTSAGLITDEVDEQQRVIRRSTAFVTVPVVVAIALAINLAWAIVRANLNDSRLNEWPFRFTTTDSATAATLLVAVVSLIIARLQWAHANRPQIGFAIDDQDQKFRVDSDEWRFWIYNSGPGVGVVQAFQYRLLVDSQDHPTTPLEWVTLDRVNELLRQEGLEDGVTHFVRRMGAGFPLAPNSNYINGSRFAYFNVQALTKIKIFDIRVVVKDSLGDVHECIFPAMRRLPSVTTKAIRATGAVAS